MTNTVSFHIRHFTLWDRPNSPLDCCIVLFQQYFVREGGRVITVTNHFVLLLSVFQCFVLGVYDFWSLRFLTDFGIDTNSDNTLHSYYIALAESSSQIFRLGCLKFLQPCLKQLSWWAALGTEILKGHHIHFLTSRIH